MKPSPQLPLLCGFSTPPLASSTAKADSRVAAAREGEGVRRVDPENDKETQVFRRVSEGMSIEEPEEHFLGFLPWIPVTSSAAS